MTRNNKKHNRTLHSTIRLITDYNKSDEEYEEIQTIQDYSRQESFSSFMIQRPCITNDR